MTSTVPAWSVSPGARRLRRRRTDHPTRAVGWPVSGCQIRWVAAVRRRSNGVWATAATGAIAMMVAARRGQLDTVVLILSPGGSHTVATGPGGARRTRSRLPRWPVIRRCRASASRHLLVTECPSNKDWINFGGQIMPPPLALSENTTFTTVRTPSASILVPQPVRPAMDISDDRFTSCDQVATAHNRKDSDV